MRKIALIPVFNEASTLEEVLETVTPRVDRLLVVDDGSTDGSAELVGSWAERHAEVELIRLPRNRGMSSALRAGFEHLAERLARGELDEADLLFNLDADGQHDPSRIDALARHVEERGLDVALTRREFSLYPLHKRLGNRLMSLWGSLLSGFPYSDVESGFRALRLGVVPALLEHYTGVRYSCAQEIAIITSRLGFRVDNSFPTPVMRYRSQTGMRDVFVNAALGLRAFARSFGGRRHAPAARARRETRAEPLS